MIARRLAGFGTTIFTEMTRLAVEHGAINLAQGFPDFDGPDFVKEAAIAAIRDGRGQYARMTGIPEIHDALSAKYRRDYGLDYRVGEELTVTSGATEAIFAAIQAICDPGDGIVLFEPYYDSYKASVVMAGGVPSFVTLEAPQWSYDPASLVDAVTERTRAILLNTPHNPTGKVFSDDELEAIARLCVERDLVCITDEVYEHMVYEGRHVPMATLPGMRERTITISSFGKTFSLTGWKIGWAAAPRHLSAAVRAAHQFITFTTSPALQLGVAYALEHEMDFTLNLTKSLQANRDLLAERLARIGFDVLPCEGTYFLTASIRGLTNEPDRSFCERLVREAGVALIPLSVFFDGEQPDHLVRFAFCKKRELLEEALRRLEDYFGKIGSR